MTSPSAAHTGIVPWGPATVVPVPVEVLVDTGHASWCPVCGGKGTLTSFTLVGGLSRAATPPPVTGTCTRCRGARLNPYHGCTFQADPPCTCTTRCSVYQPQETPTP